MRCVFNTRRTRAFHADARAHARVGYTRRRFTRHSYADDATAVGRVLVRCVVARPRVQACVGGGTRPESERDRVSRVRSARLNRKNAYEIKKKKKTEEGISERSIRISVLSLRTVETVFQ